MSRLIWIALPVVLSLAGCGFQLRGATPLPPELQAMRLECPSARERIFCQALERQLAASGIDTDAATPNYVLEVAEVQSESRALSINERGVASEIQLSLIAGFALSEADGTPVLPPTPVAASQSYRNDQNQVLGKGREEQQIRRDLSQQIALQIMTRLGTLTSERLDAVRAAETPAAEPATSGPTAAPEVQP